MMTAMELNIRVDFEKFHQQFSGEYLEYTVLSFQTKLLVSFHLCILKRSFVYNFTASLY